MENRGRKSLAPSQKKFTRRFGLEEPAWQQMSRRAIVSGTTPGEYVAFLVRESNKKSRTIEDIAEMKRQAAQKKLDFAQQRESIVREETEKELKRINAAVKKKW